jgi:hypothetical protein
MKEYLTRSVEDRLARLMRTPVDIEAVIEGASDEALSRRPDETN